MALKASGTGAFLIPTAPAVGASVTGGAANTFTTNAVEMIASTGAAIFITGIYVQLSSTSKPTYIVVRLSTGASDGTIVGEFVIPYAYTAGATGTQMMGYVEITPWIAVANATRIGAKTADSVGSLAHKVTLQCINQSNVVDAALSETILTVTGNVNGSVGSVTGAVGSVTGAVGSVTGNVGGNVVGSVASVTARVSANTDQLAGQTVTAAAGVTFPTSVASPTNITAATGVDITKILGTAISVPATAGILDVNVKNMNNVAATPITTIKAVQGLTTADTVATATNVTTVNGLAANVITAASINADAITAAKVHDDVSTEIANKVLDTDMTAHQTQGTLGQAIGDPVADTNTIYKAVVTDATGATVGVDVVAVKAETASIQADTNDIQTRLPATLSGDGYIQADLKSIEDELTSGNNAILKIKQLSISNASGDGVRIIASGDGITLAGGGNGVSVSGSIGVYVEAAAGEAVFLLSDSTDAVHVEGSVNGNGAKILGAGTGKSINAPDDIAVSDGSLTLAAIAGAVWANATRTLTSYGSLITDVWANVTRTITGGTIDTNNDKTGYALTAAYDAAKTAAQVSDIPTAVANAAEVLSAATANPIDANVQEVNDVTLQGDGSTTPWGPV